MEFKKRAKNTIRTEKAASVVETALNNAGDSKIGTKTIEKIMAGRLFGSRGGFLLATQLKKDEYRIFLFAPYMKR